MFNKVKLTTGKFAIFVENEGILSVNDYGTGDVRNFKLDPIPQHVFFSPDGNKVAYYSALPIKKNTENTQHTFLYVIDLENGEIRSYNRIFYSNQNYILSKWSPDSKYLYCIGFDEKLYRITVSDGSTKMINNIEPWFLNGYMDKDSNLIFRNRIIENFANKPKKISFPVSASDKKTLFLDKSSYLTLIDARHGKTGLALFSYPGKKEKMIWMFDEQFLEIISSDPSRKKVILSEAQKLNIWDLRNEKVRKINDMGNNTSWLDDNNIIAETLNRDAGMFEDMHYWTDMWTMNLKDKKWVLLNSDEYTNIKWDYWNPKYKLADTVNF